MTQEDRSLSELRDEVIDMKTNLRVNNTLHELSMDPRLTLLPALRDENSVHADYLLPAGTESKETGHGHKFVVADSPKRSRS